MAPPANRRSGHSRRAQYSTFFGYIAGVLGALIGAALLILSIWNPGLLSGGSHGRGRKRPSRRAARRARAHAGMRHLVDASKVMRLAGSRYRQAATANSPMPRSSWPRPKPWQARTTASRTLLGLARTRTEAGRRHRASPVRPHRARRRFATIGAGSADGVRTACRCDRRMGLVGRVLETGGSSAARAAHHRHRRASCPCAATKDGIAGLRTGPRRRIAADPADRSRHQSASRKATSSSPPARAGSTGRERRSPSSTRLTRDGAIARILSDPAATDYVTVEPVRAPEAE